MKRMKGGISVSAVLASSEALLTGCCFRGNLHGSGNLRKVWQVM